MKSLLSWKNLGWLLTAIASILLLKSGLSKVLGTTDMVNGFKFFNLSDYMSLIGFAEVLAVIGLYFKMTSKYSVVAITSLMSGAATLHLSLMGGSGVIAPVLVGVLVWAGYCLVNYSESSK